MFEIGFANFVIFSVIFVSERMAVPSRWRLKGEKKADKDLIMPKDCICQGDFHLTCLFHLNCFSI